MMTEQQQLEMMRRCSEEIKMLRRQIEQLAPKARAYDDMSAVIAMAYRPPSVGMAEDLAWRLDQDIAEIEKRHDARTEQMRREQPI